MSNITREEAIAMLKSKMDGSVDTSYEWAETVRMAIEALKDRPPRTVKLTEDIKITLDEESYEIGYTHGQMADRPHGEWKPKNNHTDYCSNCGFEEVHWRTVDYDYCPNCNAEMRCE